MAFLTNRKISAHNGGVRRKPGTLLPLEVTILEAAIDLKRRGETEFHGFAVAREIAEQEEARTLTAHGTLYKALGRMAEAGLLESRWEDPAIAAAEGRPRRRLYHVTGLGAQAIPVSNATHQAPGVHRGRLAPS
jgi:PadR family transcriptional regulator PadR